MSAMKDVLDKLQSKTKPDQLEGMTVERRLGASVPDIWKLAQEMGKDHKLTLELWKTGIAEARIMAVMLVWIFLTAKIINFRLKPKKRRLQWIEEEKFELSPYSGSQWWRVQDSGAPGR